METINVDEETLIDDINTIIRRNNYEDQSLLRSARVFATKLPDYVKQDLRLTCYCNNVVGYIFISGEQTNKFVIQYDGRGEIEQTWTEQGWKLWFTERCISILESLRNACGELVKIAAFRGAVQDQIKKALEQTV